MQQKKYGTLIRSGSGKIEDEFWSDDLEFDEKEIV
jgi:hypothetical protein